MSIEEKEIAIAEMLGAKLENWYQPNKDTGSTGLYVAMPHGKFFPNGQRYCGDKFLKFHSDVNWQFTALDFIERTHLCSISILSDFIGINALKTSTLSYWVEIDKNFKDEMGKTVNDLLPENFMTEYYSSRKEAIFEALYQFCVYLKNQKNVIT